ncbi:hypothetical protein L596_027097 [Steinernema carpocapsae]|uniref:Uncharacterized protein n=1 Tax=Steinernema carpocapsae TaxID=34508 RepID=A0A4U5M3B0_STECR|nr:hypothetical protein L596_027097 [Steinernema carpocapsae]
MQISKTKTVTKYSSDKPSVTHRRERNSSFMKRCVQSSDKAIDKASITRREGFAQHFTTAAISDFSTCFPTRIFETLLLSTIPFKTLGSCLRELALINRTPFWEYSPMEVCARICTSCLILLWIWELPSLRATPIRLWNLPFLHETTMESNV